MSLKRDIVYYIDGNELVTPDRVIPGVKRGSDNGVLHSSRYLILLKLNNEANDIATFHGIKNCIDRKGYLHRAPDDETKDTPDDHYGAISALSVLDDKTYIKLPWTCMHPMLLYMRCLQLGGISGLIGRLFSSLMAIILAFSNWNSPTTETSNRLLTWNVVHGTKKSILCRLAAKFWYKRQNKLYGHEALKEMFELYYSNNPMKNYTKE